MSQLLLFGEKEGTSGWFQYKELEKKYIEALEEKAGKGGINPKVSIPSPFARFELEQTAFRNVTRLGSKCQPRDKRIVFYSLDMAQLFFENQEGLEVVPWSINDQIAELENSELLGHKQLAQVLKLYIEQENYGFDKNEAIYMFTYKGIPIGCTSPTSLFMPTPNFTEVQDNLTIELQGGLRLFNNQKNLHERPARFVEYLYRTLGAVYRRFSTNFQIEDINDFPLSYLMNYFDSEEKMLPSSLQDKIRNWKFDDFNFDENYELSNQGVSIYGCNLYQSARADAHKQIEKISSFTIQSNKSNKKPLVLTNVKGGYDSWSYTASGKSWKYCIKNGDVPTGINKNKPKTKLPMPDGAEVSYNDGWLCEDDFLEDVIVRLPYPLDKGKFFDGNLKPAKFHKQQKEGKTDFYYYYIPPIRKKFFEFFDYNYLKETVGKTPNFCIEELSNGTVKVSLKIPVRGGQITLVKMYEDKDGDFQTMSARNKDSIFEAKGNVIECPVAINMMPFVKLTEEKNSHYSIQLLKALGSLEGIEIALQTFKKDSSTDISVPLSEYKRSDNTKYYDLDGSSFDYFMIQFKRKATESITQVYESVLIPDMPLIKAGDNTKLNFAFDFGTSNSYLAVKDNNGVHDVDMANIVCGTLDETQINIYDEDIAAIENLMLYQDQEFIPNDLGVECTFPHRTVLSYSKTNMVNANELSSLHEVNIPFIYGKGDYGIADNDIKTGFKWNSDDEKFAFAFIDELAKIAYAYAVKNGATLNKCSFIWTYPLSMNPNAINSFEGQWKRSYLKYFVNDNKKDIEDISDDEVTKMTESIAPFLKYCEEDVNISQMALSIDIGGGTSDVVIYKDSTDIHLASFRFAADNIFGGGGSKAMSNRMIGKYYKIFSRELKDADEKVRQLLKNFCSEKSQNKPSEANSVLFSLEDNPYLVDKKISYNGYLSKDQEFKVIFIYFYAAILYYLTDLLLTYGKPKPENILFSGTGSKLLNVIGNRTVLRDITTQLIQIFSNGKFQYKKDIDITMERQRPKQLTAEGALWDENNENSNEIAEIFQGKKKVIDKLIIQHTMLLSEDGDSCRTLLNKDLSDEKSLGIIISKVKDFHQKLDKLCSEDDFDLEEDYNCDKKARLFITELAQMEDKEIEDALKNIFFTRHKKKELDERPDEVLADSALFFCPIIDIIDNFLKKEQE